MHRTATICSFLSDAKCSPICTTQTCAHSGVKPSRSAKAFLQGGPKSLKKFRIFHHFETLRPYISASIKNRGILRHISSVRKKNFIYPSPLSNSRMCFDPSVTGFYRVSQKVSDLIPVLRLTPIGTQPSAVSVFSQPSIYIDGWLYGMRMTSVVCNVPVLSQNDSTYHHSVFTT